MGKFKLSLAFITLTLSSSVLADFVAFGCNGKVGSSSVDSEIAGVDGTNRFSLEDDLDIDKLDNSNYGCFLEHPVPIVPNIAFNIYSFSQSNKSAPGSSVNFMSTDFASGTSSNNALSYDYTDWSLYWKPLPGIIPFVDLSLGLSDRSYDGSISMDDGSASAELVLDHKLPLLFTAFRVDFPLLPMYAAVNYQRQIDSSYVSDDLDITVNDISMELGYELIAGLGIALGNYRSSLEIDADAGADSAHASDLTLTTNTGYLNFFLRF